MSTETFEQENNRQHQRAEAAAALSSLSAEHTECTDSAPSGAAALVRRVPVALAGVGVGGLVVGFVLPGVPFLAALGGASLFLAVLVGALRSPRSSLTTDAVFTRVAANQSVIVDGLGLSKTQVYVPTGTDPPVRLYVPRDPDVEVPDSAALLTPFVTDAGGDGVRGLSLETTGVAVAAERSVLESIPELPSDPVPLFDAVRKLLVERVDLVEGSTATVDAREGRAVLSFTGVRHGGIALLDHPASAFVAVMVALRLDRPVTVSHVRSTDGEVRVRYTWPLD